METIQAHAKRFRCRACSLLCSMMAAAMLFPPQDSSEPWAAHVGRSSAQCNSDDTVKNELRLPLVLDETFDAILLFIEVNGKSAKVVLDTGSSVTVLSPEVVHESHMETSYPVTPLKGSGYVSTGHWGTANLHLGDRYWINRRILVDEMRSLSQAHKERIDGILGRDILREFKVVSIDYEKRVLTFGSR